MKPKTVRAAALLAALLVVAAGCWNPTGEAPKAGTEAESGEYGLVVLQFNDLRALTITPEISLEIYSYELSFTRTGFQPVTVGGVPGDTTQTDPVSLLPGPWQVTVSAFNDDSPAKVIGVGAAPASVISGHTSTVSLPIRSLTGEGTLSLTAHWGELELLSPSISGTLSSGATGEESEVSMSIDGSSASFEENLEAGTYLLSLELYESETPIAGFVNAVLIVYEETSTAELEFRPVSGTVVAELADEITRPIAITLEGLQETLSPEESMTVRAETAVAVDSYQWYLDGYAIPGETGQEITIGPGLHEGEYLLTVVVKRGEIYSAEAGEFSVVPGVTEAAVAAVSAGGSHTMILDTDGTLWGTGINNYGQVGDGTTSVRRTPVKVTSGVAAVSAGRTHTMILDTDGTLWATGRNSYGQLGVGTTEHYSTPVEIMSGVAAVSAGEFHTMILDTSGTLWATGRNNRGQLGTDEIPIGEIAMSPVEVMSGVESVSAGGEHTMILKTDGTLWATGYNFFGQLGDGDWYERRTIPIQIMSHVSVASVSAGGRHTMIIDSDGRLWATGYNNSGQLGDGTRTQRLTPVRIMEEVVDGIAAVSAGGRVTMGAHTMILDTDGKLWATGHNHSGQLGDGTNERKTSPVVVRENVAAVSAGEHHTMIIDTDGTLWATGRNDVGQLGDGTSESRNTFGRVTGW